MKTTGIIASTLLAAGALAYPAKETLNCRNKPTTDGAVIKSIPQGTDVKISCQTTGESIKGNNIWDKLAEGCYVSDYYVKTGVDGFLPGVDRCGGSGGGGGSSKDVSDNGLHFIEGFEGWSSTFYRDSAGVLTIGYGHACQPDSACSSIHPPISKAEGDKLLRSDAQTAVRCINSNVKTSLTQNQFDACVSFTFNLGCGNFQNIVGWINSRNFAEMEVHWLRYNKAGGKELPGLVRRRKEEIALFKK